MCARAGARLLRWRAGPAAGDLDIARAPRAVPLAPLALHDGLVVRLDGRVDGHLLDGVRDDVVTLSFALRGDRAGHVREYGRDSGALLRAAGIAEDSRTHMLLTMLRLMRRTDAGGCFDRATRAAPFHLRWNAMREWLALDAGAALPRLAAMAADDPNAEVRAAARALRANFWPAREDAVVRASGTAPFFYDHAHDPPRRARCARSSIAGFTVPLLLTEKGRGYRFVVDRAIAAVDQAG